MRRAVSSRSTGFPSPPAPRKPPRPRSGRRRNPRDALDEASRCAVLLFTREHHQHYPAPTAYRRARTIRTGFRRLAVDEARGANDGRAGNGALFFFYKYGAMIERRRAEPEAATDLAQPRAATLAEHAVMSPGT